MLITIEQRHTIGTEYQNCNDCALARALRERLPGERVIVGGLGVDINWKWYEFDSYRWDEDAFDLLQQGKITSITLKSKATTRHS
jgi:hypothetical protein